MKHIQKLLIAFLWAGMFSACEGVSYINDPDALNNTSNNINNINNINK